ncbi:acid protease [Heliocybe sulcata]|uniref:Acid protease n=1 Tax=Heliocybe sulcata TaxID=5364 RepID=A0A5C3N0P8_9AGAM|nr:acid protease [Heliocybe sulcata]
MTFHNNIGEFTSNVTFGGSQTLQIEIDTGSADLWVMSSLEPSALLSGHSYYNSGKSTTFHALNGYTWGNHYADSSSDSGNVIGTENVNVGGVTVTTVIELANNVSSSFSSRSGRDGIMGLGRKSNGLNTVHYANGTYAPQKTFFENIMNSLEQPIFALYLKPGSSGASIDFGYIDDTKYSGSLVEAPLVDSVYWRINSTSSKVGSTIYANTVGTAAIIDSGTTLIYVWNDIATHLYEAIDGAQFTSSNGWVFPCNSSLPSFELLVGSYYAIVGTEQLNFKTVGNGYCQGSVQVQKSTDPYMIFGLAFLATQYMVLDPTNNVLRFALLK